MSHTVNRKRTSNNTDPELTPATTDSGMPFRAEEGSAEQLVLDVEDSRYDQRLLEELDSFLQFKDQSLQQEFLHYCHKLQTQSNVFLIFVTLFFTIIMLTGSVSAIKLDLECSNLPNFYPRLATSIISSVAALSTMVIGILVYSLKSEKQRGWKQVKVVPDHLASSPGSTEDAGMVHCRSFTEPHPLRSKENSANEWMQYCTAPFPYSYDSPTPPSTYGCWKSLKERLHYLNSNCSLQSKLMVIFAMQLQICFTCAFIRRAYNFNCFPHRSPGMELVGGSLCYADDIKTNIITSNAVYLLLIPVLFMLGLPEVPIKVVWLLHCFSIVIFFAIVVSRNSYSSIPIALAWISTACILVREFQIRNLLIFLTNRKLRQAIKANHKIQSESHATEMRHLISNMAHDLKTPLSSFITGVEYIQLTVDHFRTSLQERNCVMPADAILDFVSNVNLCLNNIRNTNAFMLMTINRCIDYTKASKGMQLIPRYESLHLVDALQLPISCMINVQTRIQIQLQPLSREICSHVLTDKQWLQENMLCLLSNAVKYSTEGDVVVRVSLQSKEFEDDMDDALPQQPSRISEGNEDEGETDDREPTTRMYASPSNLSQSKSHASSEPFSELQSEHEDAATYLLDVSLYLRIEVEDAGIGMSEEAMQLLFHPIKQTQRVAGGAGLGLFSLAKRVEALHGEYGVKKRPDGRQGLLFWFAIPYRPDASYLRSPKKEVPKACVNLADPRLNPSRYPWNKLQSFEPVNGALKSEPLTILVVDDSPSILKMTGMMLTKLGHQVITAENGSVALDVALSAFQADNHDTPRFDLILMDLQMPVMDGLEATKHIRRAEASQQCTTPSLIIGVSANSDHETTKASYEAGVDAFLSKPFNIASFQELYQKVLLARQALALSAISSS